MLRGREGCETGSFGVQVIRPEDLGTGIKEALEASGADAVSLVEPGLEVPRLEIVMEAGAGPPLQVSFGEAEPLALRLEATILEGLGAGDESEDGVDLEFVLRMLNEVNRLEGTPWKFWLRGMGVEFEGVMSGGLTGEVWATWNIPAELLSVDDVSSLCRRFSEGLGRLDLSGLV